MKKLTFLLSAFFVILFVVSGTAQNKSIIIEDGEGFFKEQDDVMIAEFVLKGIPAAENVKYVTENVLMLDGVVKFGIKNYPLEGKETQRECLVVLKKENYVSSFTQVMSLLKVTKVELGEVEKEITDFIEDYRK